MFSVDFSDENSDNEPYGYQQTQQFEIHLPVNKKYKKNTSSSHQKIKIREEQTINSIVNDSALYMIIKQCENIQRNVRQEAAQNFSTSLISIIRQNTKNEIYTTLPKNNKKKTKQQNHSKNQRQFGSKLIIPIKVRKNQGKAIEEFINFFYDKHHTQNLQNQSSDDQTMPHSEVSLFNFGQFEHIILYKSQSNNIQSLLLDLYTGLQLRLKSNKKVDLIIVLSTNILNLSSHNCYVVEEWPVIDHLVFVLPTLSKFDNYSGGGIIKNIQVIPYNIDCSSKLFCQFMLQCMKNKVIKPYFPVQILTLLRQIDSFPISFEQSCRRFIYCIKSMYLEVNRLSLKVHYVEFETLIYKIYKSYKKGFNEFRFALDKKKLEIQSLMCILDKNRKYCVLDDLFESISNFYQSTQFNSVNQSKITRTIREKLQQYLKEDDSLKKYLKKLYIKPVEQKKTRGKTIQKTQKQEQKIVQNTQNSLQKKVSFKNRGKSAQKYKDISCQKQLQINKISNKNDRQELQEIIHEIILTHTSHIRQIGQKIKWGKIKYQRRIKPPIPYEIYKNLMLDPLFNHIYQRVNTEAGSSLSEVLWHYSNFMSPHHSSGEITFVLKQLALYGLIFIRNYGMNPHIYPNFFDKSRY